MTAQDRSMLIKAALTPAREVRAPIDLAGEIRLAVGATPQRRPALGGRVGAGLGAPWLPGVAPRLAWAVVVVALALAALVALAVASRLNPAPSNDILSYHGNPAQTGVVPGPAPVEPVSTAWQKDLNGSVTALQMPLVYAGTVYQLDGHGTLTAFDEATGGVLWHGSGFGTAGGPVISGGLIVVAGSTGTVVAFDATTGQQRWRREIGAPTLAPLAASGERIFVGSEDGTVHILDRASGTQTGSPLAAGGPVERSPAIADGVAYVAAFGGHLTAFDVETGVQRWRAELGDGEIATPAVADGTVYVAWGAPAGTAPYEVVAVDAATGTERWRWATPDHHRLFLGAVTDATVYAVSEDGNVYAIDIATHAGRLFFATGGPIESPATIVDGQLFVSSGDRTVYALDLTTGTARWTMPVTGIPFTPAVSGGRVFVGTDLGKLVAIGGGGGMPASP